MKRFQVLGMMAIAALSFAARSAHADPHHVKRYTAKYYEWSQGVSGYWGYQEEKCNVHYNAYDDMLRKTCYVYGGAPIAYDSDVWIDERWDDEGQYKGIHVITVYRSNRWDDNERYATYYVDYRNGYHRCGYRYYYYDVNAAALTGVAVALTIDAAILADAGGPPTDPAARDEWYSGLWKVEAGADIIGIGAIVAVDSGGDKGSLIAAGVSSSIGAGIALAGKIQMNKATDMEKYIDDLAKNGQDSGQNVD